MSAPQPTSPQPQHLPSSTRVAIIGGGIVGVSIACQLAEAGVDGVVVIEQQTLGSGSSEKPIGGFRAQFSDPTNIDLGLRSMVDYFLPFRQRYGVDIDIDQRGYLFLIDNDDDLAAYAQATDLQRSLGVTAEMLTPSQVQALNPYVDPTGIIGGQFSPMAGNARPALIIQGFAAAARRAGATILEHLPVLGVDRVAEGAHLIRTDAGVIAAETVIIAAGAWSRGVGQMVGLNLPVTPVRRQLAFTPPCGTELPRIPFTLDATSTAYFHNVGPDSLLFGYADPAEQPGFDRSYTETWLPKFYDFARAKAPALDGQPTERGWAGYYELTPDHNALIGRTEDGSVLYATGFSGHGVLQSPAVGEVITDLYLGRTPFTDVSRFSAERFAHGRDGLAKELAII